MLEPITIATATAATAKVGGAAAEGTATAGAVAAGTEVAGGLAVSGESAGVGTVGKTTEAFVGMLKADVSSVAEGMLERARASGAGLVEAMGKGTSMELGRFTVGRGAETAISDLKGFDPTKWVDWKPALGQHVGPQMVAERFRPLRDPDNLESYARNLGQRNPGFGRELERRAQQLREARTPAERDAALQHVRKSTAGKLGEAIAIEGFNPFFEKLEVQRRVETPNGTTFVDGQFTGAKSPLVLGRGHSVSKGGNLAIEVKTGQPAYLEREVRHITERQVQGHLASGNRSLVVMSHDVSGMEGERAVRGTVGEAGSYVMALLPEKKAMDEALMRVLRDRTERA